MKKFLSLLAVFSLLTSVGWAETESLLSYTLTSTETSAQTNLTAGNGIIYFGATGKFETQSNLIGYKADGDISATSTRYVLLKPSKALKAGDIINVSMFATSNPSGSDYGFSIYTSRGNDVTAVTTLYLGSKEKNVVKTYSYTVTEGDALVGCSEIYLFRATGKSTYFVGAEITSEVEEQETNTFTGEYSVTGYIDYTTIAAGQDYYNDWTSEPSQGTYTFTGAGTISGGSQIAEVPGITMTVGAANDGTTWKVENVSTGSFNNTIAAYNETPANRWDITSGCFFKFEPIVNGYLTVSARTTGNAILAENGAVYDAVGANLDGRSEHTFTKPLLAGHTYYLCANSQNGISYLHSFSFRPAFLAPTDYTAEQTGEFAAGIGTTAYPKVLTEANSNVSHWARRDVASITSTGDVTINGNGWTIVGANVYQPGNSDRHLTAIYTMQTSVLEVTSTSPENGKVIDSSIEDGYHSVVSFVFDQDITISNNATVTMMVDATTKVMDVSSGKINVEPNNSKQLNISVDTEDDIRGANYTFIISAGSVFSNSNSQLGNSEITLNFSRSSDEPTVKMVYPTDIYAANVGTPIALKLDYPNSSAVQGIVVGYLKAEGEEGEGMIIYSFLNDLQYVFRPTTTLQPNTKYTLTVAGGQMRVTENDIITNDKAFTFTTGSSAGDAPQLVSSTPTDGQYGDIPQSGTLSLTFDQELTLLPYAEIKATPVNGSESYVEGNNYQNPVSLILSEDKKTLSVDYAAGDQVKMKYDVTYELLVPANTVYGPAGQPNEDIKIYFRVGKNQNARDITLPYMDGKHPYTWDFEKMGILTDTYTNFETATGSKTKSWWQTSGNTYGHNSQTGSRLFPSGEEIFIREYTDGDNVTHEKYYPDEFKGIRICVTNERNANRPQITKPNSETRTGSNLYLNGNTNYMTIPNVPAGAKVYIGADSHDNILSPTYKDGSNFSINSPNAVFLNNYVEGNNTIGNSSRGHKIYIVQMGDTQGDLTFCCSDMTIHKIAISVDDKELTEYAGIAYATDCQAYPVEYSLTKYFEQGDVTGMYILSGDSQNAGVNSSSSSIFSTDIKYAAGVKREENGIKVNQGTIVKATAPNSSTLEEYTGKYVFPYFTTDVNTLADELYSWDAANAEKMQGNMLVGVVANDTILTRETEDNEICYVFTATRYTTDANGNLTYLQPKDDKNWNKEAPEQEGDKWYITETDGTKVYVTYDETKKVYFLLDESGNKIPKVKVASLPSFQPVMRRDVENNTIDIGNLEPNVWILGPHKSYLKLTKGTSVNEVVFLNGEGDEEVLDGINTVNNGVVMESGAWYTLQGVKLNGTPKQQGIYIYNNKKVLIK